jgi:hypothetical protein
MISSITKINDSDMIKCKYIMNQPNGCKLDCDLSFGPQLQEVVKLSWLVAFAKARAVCVWPCQVVGCTFITGVDQLLPAPPMVWIERGGGRGVWVMGTLPWTPLQEFRQGVRWE